MQQPEASISVSHKEENEVGVTSKFWSLYKQDFRCLQFYDQKVTSNITKSFKRSNPLSKINPENIIKGVVNEANELNSEKYEFDVDNAVQWSKDNYKMELLFMEVGYDKNTTMNRGYIRERYTELDFTSTGVTSIDKELLLFPNLKVLELSQNSIKQIKNIPQQLEELILSQNLISSIHSKMRCPSLLYLNVAFNELTENHLSNIG